MSTMKRLVSGLVALAILISMLPTVALAQDSTGIGDRYTDTVPEANESTGFPEYVTVLPEGTEYFFNDDESTIFFPNLDQEIAAGDTFVVYIGTFPAAYIAGSVSAQGKGIAVDVTKAPAEIYQNVGIDTVLDVKDSIVTANTEAGVTGSVGIDTITFASSPEIEGTGTGTISLELSQFRINYPANESPTLSVNYELTVDGNFEVELDDADLGEKNLDWGIIRFLGIGTFEISLLLEAKANMTITQTGTFVFSLDPDDPQVASITDNGNQNVGKFEGEGELKVGISIAAGVDVFVAKATMLTGSAGLLGKLERETVPDPDNELSVHSHTDLSCFFFLSLGAAKAEMGVELPLHVYRDCEKNCGTPEKEVNYTFENAAEDDSLFEVNTNLLETIMERLPRMLCGNQTITGYTELEKDCSVEAGSTLTIAEGQTLEVHGNMEQRGVVELASDATLIVHGNYQHDSGTLTLGEGAALLIDGNYTIYAPPKPLIDGKIKLEFTIEGEIEIEDDDGVELSPEEGSEHYEICVSVLSNTVLILNSGSQLFISGNLYQDGGTIEDASYPEKCRIQVGEEGAETGGNYMQTSGNLNLNDNFEMLVHRDYRLSGGSAYLVGSISKPAQPVTIGGEYFQESDAQATFLCDVAVGGNFSLSGSGTVCHSGYTMTLGGDFKQSGDSSFNAENTAALCFRNGRTHKVEFDAPENSDLGRLICEDPQTDTLDVPNGMPVFYLGSNISTVGDLRLVRGAESNSCLWFEGYGLTVAGNLIQDGSNIGNFMGASESVQLAVGGSYVITDGYLRANSGTISVGRDFRMQGYDTVAGAVSNSVPSTGGFHTSNTEMTVGGTLEVHCNMQDGNQGFNFTQASDAATLSVRGDLIQRNCADSDPTLVPFKLGGSYKLIFNGEDGPQRISFETEPTLSGDPSSPAVINQNPAGLIWGSNTEKLAALLPKYTVVYDANGGTGAPESQTKSQGQVLTLSSTVPVLEDHIFLGWATDAAASLVEYPAGGSFDTDENATLYAVWKKKESALSIVSQPVNITVESGTAAATEVVAKGDGLTYTWYLRNPGQTKFYQSSIKKSVYSFIMEEKYNGRQVYCVITDAYGNILTTDTVTLSMKRALAITQQPKSVAVISGTKAATTVEAEGENLTYTWYLSNPGQTKFYKSAIRTNTYSVTMSDAANGRRVYCVVKDAYGDTMQSNVATLSMKTALAITQQPKSIAVSEGEIANVSFTAIGDNLTYKWYYRNASASKFSPTGAFSGSRYYVAMTEARDGRQLYCKVTDEYGDIVTTDTVTISMVKSAPVAIITQPKSVTVAEGETAKVTVQAAGDGLIYRWYYKNAGDAEYTYTSTFTSNYYKVTMNSARNGRRVLCKIYDQYGNTVKSNSVTLNMK